LINAPRTPAKRLPLSPSAFGIVTAKPFSKTPDHGINGYADFFNRTGEFRGGNGAP